MAEIETEEGPLPVLSPDEQTWLFSEERKRELHAHARAKEKREAAAREYAEEDTTCFGHDGIHYIASDEWGICLEDPDRNEVLTFMDPEHPKIEKNPLVKAAKRSLSRAAD